MYHLWIRCKLHIKGSSEAQKCNHLDIHTIFKRHTPLFPQNSLLSAPFNQDSKRATPTSASPAALGVTEPINLHRSLLLKSESYVRQRLLLAAAIECSTRQSVLGNGSRTQLSAALTPLRMGSAAKSENLHFVRQLGQAEAPQPAWDRDDLFAILFKESDCSKGLQVAVTNTLSPVPSEGYN